MTVPDKLYAMLAWAYSHARVWARDEEGATLVEYGLLVALIAVLVMAALQILGVQINTMFCQVVAQLSGSC